MKCYLIAVTLTLTVLVQVCHLKSIVHESSSGIKAESYEWDFLKEVKPEHHGRQKRFIGAIFGFAKVITGATRLGLSVANDKKQNAAIADIQRSLARQGDDITDVQRSLAKQGDDITDIQDTLALHHREMTYVKAKLQDLDGKLDTLSKDVESLAQLTADGQQRLEAGQDRLLDGQQKIQAGQQRLHGRLTATCLYGKDVARLRFFLSHLNNFLTLQNDSSLAPKELAETWADGVVDMGVDGVAQLLHGFHDMVMGSDPLFGHKPIFQIFENGLDRDSSIYWYRVIEIAEFLYSIQVSGYAVWFAALNIKGRHSEVANVQRMAMDRLTEQKRVMEPLLLEWPNGTYGLPMTDTGCPLAAGVEWKNGTRYQHSAGGNGWTTGIHFPTGSYNQHNMKQHFCMKTGTGGRGSWPKGNYCLFMKGDTCPSGFSSGFLRWDDEDDNNANSASGSLPDGKYDQDTLIFFCCRSDGPSSTPIDLPNRKPFYLFKYQSDSQCQEVRGMKVKEEGFRWDTENSHDHSFVYGAHPYTPYTTYNFKIYYCYYHS